MASRSAGDTVRVLSGIEFRIVFHPFLHLLAFVCVYLPIGRFEASCLALGRTKCLLNPSYIHQLFPVVVAVSIAELYVVGASVYEATSFRRRLTII